MATAAGSPPVDDRVRRLPTGTVTFLFTDIEASTKLLERVGDAYAQLLETHAALIRGAVAAAGGVEVSTEGDAFFVAFRSAKGGAAAAAEACPDTTEG
ncbi:MAG TPA: adenylate/guanylate cyclase domain-containing protein [Acidimicrobiia bacterium]